MIEYDDGEVKGHVPLVMPSHVKSAPSEPTFNAGSTVKDNAAVWNSERLAPSVTKCLAANVMECLAMDNCDCPESSESETQQPLEMLATIALTEYLTLKSERDDLERRLRDSVNLTERLLGESDFREMREYAVRLERDLEASRAKLAHYQSDHVNLLDRIKELEERLAQDQGVLTLERVIHERDVEREARKGLEAGRAAFAKAAEAGLDKLEKRLNTLQAACEYALNFALPEGEESPERIPPSEDEWRKLRIHLRAALGSSAKEGE